MKSDHLIHMANQIGQFFAAYPDPAEARDSIALHLKKFWSPPMRQGILDCLATPQAAQLLPLVHEALVQHAEGLRPGGLGGCS